MKIINNYYVLTIFIFVILKCFVTSQRDMKQIRTQRKNFTKTPLTQQNADKNSPIPIINKKISFSIKNNIIIHAKKRA